MSTRGALSASSSRPSALVIVVLAIAVLAVRNAGAASVPRAAPLAAAEPRTETDSPLLEPALEPLQDPTLAGQGEELDEATLQALHALSSLGGLQDHAGTLEINVPGDVWGLADSLLLRDGSKPSERISLPFLPSILPHVNTSCSCKHWQCSCCATVEVTPLQRNKTGCASLSYVKDQLAVVLRLSLNNRTLAERELISGSHPPPFCFPVPQLPIITVCLRFSNISLTNDAKVQACAAVELGLVFTSPLIRLRFGCLRIGPGGVGWASKPVTHSLISGTDIETDALQQFAAAINATDKDQQFLLLQSILRQDSSVFNEPQPAQLPRSSKMTWPNYQRRIRYS